MDNLITYSNYEQYKSAMKKVLNRTVEDFVVTGYLLKKGRDTDILKDSGYANVNEFAAAEYNLDATQVSRYIRINDKFSENGYSEQLQERYQGYGYTKLALMLTLPESVNEELSQTLSKSEIQAVKEEIESEQSVTDIEVMLEGEKEEQKELGNLEKALHQLFDDEPELFVELYECVQRTDGELKYIQEILAPAGEKVYSVRIQGLGRIMMFLRDNEQKITVHKVREEVKEYYEWENITQYLKEMVTNQAAKERWSELYRREFPEPEIAPVQQQKPKQRKESKVKKAKKEEKKHEKSKNVSNNGSTGVSEEIKKPETETGPQESEETVGTENEIVEVNKTIENHIADTGKMVEEEIPGQMELTRDMPEYCPEQQQKAETGQQESKIGQQEEIQEPESHYGSRKQYLDALSIQDAAKYIAKFVREISKVRFSFADTWEKWLAAEVDENGEEIEVVE